MTDASRHSGENLNKATLFSGSAHHGPGLEQFPCVRCGSRDRAQHVYFMKDIENLEGGDTSRRQSMHTGQSMVTLVKIASVCIYIYIQGILPSLQEQLRRGVSLRDTSTFS